MQKLENQVSAPKKKGADISYLTICKVDLTARIEQMVFILSFANRSDLNTSIAAVK
jgi:hypothetical protein